MRMKKEIENKVNPAEAEALFPFWGESCEEEQGKLCNPIYKQSFKARTFIDLQALENDENVFFVVRGRVSMMLVNEDGRRICFLRLQKGDWSICLNHIKLIKSLYIECFAEKNAQIWYYPVKEIIHLFRTESLAGRYMLLYSEKVMCELLNTIGDMAFCSLKDRLVKLLYQYADEFASNEVYITHEILADNLGSSREVISRLLKQLEEAGEIELGRKKIVLLYQDKRMMDDVPGSFG